MEDGNWLWRGRTPQGEVQDAGKHIVGWVKRDGEWKMFRDIFNSDQAAPTPYLPGSR